jgi:chromosome segregation protein
MTVRIKKLDLNGFKSFPRSTVFEFDTGITAIIGPNGSGKSNIADAMRWVLGEQSYSNLRGRKAEDVIFSGSTARSAVGMAEVTLTLDNTSGELPIEFQEVSITRRAYRSGENQYLINGSRVRLKDVNHITSSLGQAHTVIGQGLVDAALSQRPEERRGLFEHAAGITGLRMKYAATARHLAETTANSTRLDDLLNELEPRLKTLERQAKQARESAEVQANLRETTLRYYATLWREHQERLQELRRTRTETEEALEQANADLAGSDSVIQRLESELGTLQERADTLDEEILEKRSELREIEHRIELTRQRRETLLNEIDRYQERRSALATEAEQVDTNIAAQETERETIQHQLAELDVQLTQQQQDRASLDEQLQSITTRCDAIDSERESVRQRLYRAQAEQEFRLQQQDELQDRAASIETRRAELDSHITEIEQLSKQAEESKTELEQSLKSRTEEMASIESELASARAETTKLREELEKLDTDRSRKSARLDALQRLQESGEGLHRGVQTVLDATKSGKLNGIIGTLASQITVPKELETAIEAALGGHLQDVIVQSWADAEAAIGLLKKQNAGRATFQPLDTQRRSGNPQRPSIQGEPGVHGFAADLIAFSTEMEPVLEGLIGRTVITDDLPSTRRILNKLRHGWTVVTLEGEITRSGGSVTGGSRIRQSGTLGRERELRDLPADIDHIDQRRVDLHRKIDEAANDRSECETRLEDLRKQVRRLEGEADAAVRELNDLQRQLQQARHQFNNLKTETSTTSNEAEARADEIEQLGAQHQQDEARLAVLDQQREELATRIDDLRGTIDDTELRRLESERSRLAERLHGIEQQNRSLLGQRQRLSNDIKRADVERDSTSETIEQLESELATLRHQAEVIRTELEELTSDQAPLAKQRESLQQDLSSKQTELRQLQSRQRELERQQDNQRFDIERETSQGEHLIERVVDILEIEDPTPLLQDQPVEEVLDLQKLETDLHRLRQRARRIGAFGEETITQYEQEQERFTFLRGQLDDVQSGAEALQSMLHDLEKAMSEEFDRTFGQVAQAFQSTFQRLFGGGSAQLVRNDEEDSTGIDIVAQPPGKKLQSLALLSGGERALTAVALLFAIQRVNPSPFCLLDEVDAALDEANVVRFRDELRDLSVNTQFVIVTHNRATIEGADVLYGITMGTDAVSRIVSLKLPEEAPVATA